MPDEHESFPQPRGNPDWCFCRVRDCPGWAAYLAWYQADTGGDGEPDDAVVGIHRQITRTLADLARRYSESSGIEVDEVDLNEALDWAATERAAEPPG